MTVILIQILRTEAWIENALAEFLSSDRHAQKAKDTRYVNCRSSVVGWWLPHSAHKQRYNELHPLRNELFLCAWNEEFYLLPLASTHAQSAAICYKNYSRVLFCFRLRAKKAKSFFLPVFFLLGSKVAFVEKFLIRKEDSVLSKQANIAKKASYLWSVLKSYSVQSA